MSKLTCSVLATALALCLTTGEAAAWNRATNRQILENAIWLMPQALKIILVEHRDEVYRGCFEAMEKLPEPEILWHTTSGDGVGPRELDRAVQEAVHLINSQRPFGEVAYQFGRVSYLLAELNNPLRIDEPDRFREVYYPDYMAYVADNLPQLSFGFDGFRPDLLVSVEALPYAQQVAERTKPLEKILGETLVKGEKILPMQQFGPRSIPFGVTEIAYSRSVNDVADLWYAIWRKVRGDLSNPTIQ